MIHFSKKKKWNSFDKLKVNINLFKSLILKCIEKNEICYSQIENKIYISLVFLVVYKSYIYSVIYVFNSVNHVTNSVTINLSSVESFPNWGIGSNNNVLTRNLFLFSKLLLNVLSYVYKNASLLPIEWYKSLFLIDQELD